MSMSSECQAPRGLVPGDRERLVWYGVLRTRYIVLDMMCYEAKRLPLSMEAVNAMWVLYPVHVPYFLRYD